MRSWLFVPGDSERKIAKALSGNADVIILDLEDSVAPANKDRARDIVTAMLAERPATAAKIYVRVNPLDSPYCAKDTAALSQMPPDGYMLPKSQSGKDVTALAQQTGTDVPIIAIATETAASLFHLASYANITAPLTAISWGAEDLSADLGAMAARDSDNNLTAPYRLARSLCLIGARAAQVEPIDSIYANFHDNDGLKAECEAAMRDGFTGKMAIHPDQVDTINRTFTPSLAARTHAEEIVNAFAANDPQDTDKGVVSLNGQMYDLPHLKRAQKLLQRFEKYQQRQGPSE